MGAQTLHRAGTGISLKRLGLLLLALAIVLFGFNIVTLLTGGRTWWWVWLVIVVALLGWAFTGDVGMALYVLRRLLWAIVVVNIVVFITFLIFFKLPNG